jgi:hypothetical protein
VKDEAPILRTCVGHAEWGDNRFRGYSVARDLAGWESVSSLLALAIVGRRIDENERLMLDDLATVTNVADARIWPLKLVRVTAAYGGCNAAVAALTVGLENTPIGHHATGRAAELLLQLRDGLLANGCHHATGHDGALEDQCRQLLADSERHLEFWVPFRPRDERVDMLSERVAARGRGELPYWRLFANAAETFWRIKRVRPNMGLAAAAICLDMGFTPAQIGPLITALAVPAYWANAFEGAGQMPLTLQTLPESSVRYLGPPSRVSPRAAQAKQVDVLRPTTESR